MTVFARRTSPSARSTQPMYDLKSVNLESGQLHAGPPILENEPPHPARASDTVDLAPQSPRVARSLASIDAEASFGGFTISPDEMALAICYAVSFFRRCSMRVNIWPLALSR